MNLLDKIWVAGLVSMPLFIFSCEEESAVSLDSEALTAELTYEEITLSATNVYLDSIRTSGASQLLVGRTTDDIFGNTSSNAMVQLTSNETELKSLENRTENGVVVAQEFYEFEQAILNLEVSYVHATGGSLDADQTIEVRQLDDRILTGVYYLSDFEIPLVEPELFNVFSYNLTDPYYITQGTDTVNSISIVDALEAIDDEDDTLVYKLKLPLNSEIGNQLFNIANSGDLEDLLRESFKGLALLSGENDEIVVGFNPIGSTIDMIYRIDERVLADGSVNQIETDTIEFILNGSRYNQLITDRTNSLVATQFENNGDEFILEEGFVFAYPAAGVFPKVSLQPLKSFFTDITNQNGFVQVNRAEIELISHNSIPEIGFSTSEFKENLEDVRFFFMDENSKMNTSAILSVNEIIDAGILTDGSYITVDIASRNFNRAVEENNNENSTYTAISTLFVQQWADELIEADYLVLFPSDINNMNSTAFKIDEIKFKLYYAETN